MLSFAENAWNLRTSRAGMCRDIWAANFGFDIADISRPLSWTATPRADTENFPL